jgi:hypothetical protein
MPMEPEQQSLEPADRVKLARGHFAVPSLERKYGETRVREEFERIRAASERSRRPESEQ